MEENMNQEINETAVQEESGDSTESNKQTSGVKRKNLVNDIIEIVESTLITVFVIVLIFTYLLHPVNVVGESMVPTLNDKDKVFMTMVTANISNGDIIVVDNDAAYLINSETKDVYAATSGRYNECIIKRVIACGGQTINISADGAVTVDGKVIDEPYINDIINNPGRTFEFPVEIPEGYYFVMGDNRNRSADSRDPNVGLIKADQIYGKAVMRYSPDLKIL